MGVLTGATPIMAQHLGARRFRRIRPAVRNAAWLALLLVIPISVAAWFSSPILCSWARNHRSPTMDNSISAICSGASAAVALVRRAHGVPRGPCPPRAVFVVTLFGIALNALLDYTLMFGNFGAPNMGMKGAGVASLVVSWVMFLALLGFVLKDRQFRRYRLLGRLWRIEWPVMVEIVKIGSPIAVTELTEMGMYFVTTLMMGMLGVEALAAHAVTAQCYGLVFMIPVGLAQAGAVRVGRAAGARDGVGLARSGWAATTLAGLLVLVPAIVFWFAGRFVAGLILDPSYRPTPRHSTWRCSCSGWRRSS